ncbi:MAG: hypothetical protein ABSA83_23980 [Verrucomicrobiota bacterium]|jgi:hypothetical protein
MKPIFLCIFLVALSSFGAPDAAPLALNDGHHEAVFSNALALIHLPANSRADADVDAAVSTVVRLYAAECASLQAEEVDLIDRTVHKDFIEQRIPSRRHEHLYAILQAGEHVEGNLQAAMMRKRIALERESLGQAQTRLGMTPDQPK